MNVLVSPYHLTTRELPALASALLAKRVFTLLPTPEETDRAAVRRALNQHPAYLRLLESWRWAAPLFLEHVVESLCDGVDAVQSIPDAIDVLTKKSAYRELAGFVDTGPFAQRGRMLDAFSADMLKGGPNPGLSIPLAGALDWFAAEHGLIVARSGVAARPAGVPGVGAAGGNAMSASLALRAESSLGQTLVSFMAPVISSASAAEILDAREELAGPLDDLRGSIDEAMRETGAIATKHVRSAATAYAKAFSAHTKGLLGRDDAAGKRLMASECSFVLRRLPGDAAFVSSIAALRQAKARGLGIGKAKGEVGAAGGKACEPPTAVLGMVVTAMGGLNA